MSFFAAAFLGALAVHAAPISARSDLPQCNGVAYEPSTYTCYDDANILCPIINGDVYGLCGSGCYSTHVYSCKDEKLSILPGVQSPFTLTASAPGSPIDGKTIQAAGEAFWLGSDSPATYCPSSVPAAACPAGNTTVFASGGLMVEVPGGQQTYIKNSGALSFTQAHSAFEPDLASGSTSAFNGSLGGGFYGPGLASWTACMTTAPSVNTTGVWQVYAQMPNLTFASNCTGFTALVNDVPSGTLGAWQYI